MLCDNAGLYLMFAEKCVSYKYQNYKQLSKICTYLENVMSSVRLGKRHILLLNNNENKLFSCNAKTVTKYRTTCLKLILGNDEIDS